MTTMKLERYICICTNKYGVVTRAFQADRFPSMQSERKDIAKSRGILMDEDEVEIQRLDDHGDIFLFNKPS